MSETAPQAPLPNPLGPIEPNVTLAGLEGIATAWFGYYAVTGAPIDIHLDGEWHWYLAIYVVFALVGVVVVGLATEGLAGLLERAVTKKWWGSDRGGLWHWYQGAVRLPESWGPGQRWIWKSEQANREFARRRLRLLVSRNTAACFVFVTVLGAAGLVLHGTTVLGVATIGGLVATLLFGFLWLDAHEGWNKAVQDAGEIGEP